MYTSIDIDASSVPFGMILGLIHPINSYIGIAIRGIIEGLAAGVLLFDVLVHLLIPFFSSVSFRGASKRSRLIALMWLWTGVGMMSVVGIWA